MYKGPSEAYEAYDFTIPFGAEIKAEYANADIWLYGEYNGNKGWFMYYNGSFGIYENTPKKPLVTAAKVEIKESIADNAKTIGTIPAGTSFNEYYDLDAWTWLYYVTYNGVTGYIDSEKTLDYVNGEYLDGKYIVGTDVDIYETADEKSKKVGTLEALKVFYFIGTVGNHDDYYYIECDDLKGYIPNDYENLYFISETDEYYDDLLEGKITYEEYLAIDEDEEIDDEYYEEEIEEEFEDEVEADDEENEDEKESSNQPKEDEVLIGPKEMVILCVGGATIVALTAIVVIILMNKKSKKNINRQDVKVDIPSEQNVIATEVKEEHIETEITK